VTWEVKARSGSASLFEKAETNGKSVERSLRPVFEKMLQQSRKRIGEARFQKKPSTRFRENAPTISKTDTGSAFSKEAVTLFWIGDVRAISWLYRRWPAV
jgi:hypothetical protein